MSESALYLLLSLAVAGRAVRRPGTPRRLEIRALCRGVCRENFAAVGEVFDEVYDEGRNPWPSPSEPDHQG